MLTYFFSSIGDFNSVVGLNKNKIVGAVIVNSDSIGKKVNNLSKSKKLKFG